MTNPRGRRWSLVWAAARETRAQSVVEFAILFPIMLALVGVTIDFARVYRAYIDLESASRSAAEQLAQNVDNAVTSANAGTRAKSILEAETTSTFTVGPLGSCATPTVAATYATATGSLGASTSYPIGTATVNTCIPFRPLFAYPLLTSNGTWILRSEQAFSIVQGR